MTLITVERISIFFPRMRQKIERFYHSVVEVNMNEQSLLLIQFIIYHVLCLYLLKCQEALLGKDPDFAEDFNNGQFSTDKILRERQRQEICGALNGSSTYFYLFMLKNILEIFLGILFIIANVLIALNSEVDLLEIIGYFQICKLMLFALGRSQTLRNPTFKPTERDYHAVSPEAL